METIEWDAVWMSLVVFVPSVFALIVLLIPRGWDEVMRWVTLIGTAMTLGVSLCMFISFYHDTIEFTGAGTDPTGVSVIRATLGDRAYKADFASTGSVHLSNDWLARYSWIPRFNVDYYLGADGICMALVLLPPVPFFLSLTPTLSIDNSPHGH